MGRLVGIILFLSFLFLPFSAGSQQRDYATKEDIQMVIKLLEETKDSLNNRIDDLRETMFWLFGTFIGIALILIGFVIRNLWFLGHEVKVVKQSLETQRDELNFLKGLIEKLVVGRQ
ncbi:MAG: hypothetical protein N2257_08470 [Thermodesulfovibrionales bacterium]|nr:hypothetical protein [Thermodesulfovibrionales bacterium]